MSRAERSPRGSRAPLPAGFWTLWTTVALDLIGFGIVVPILGQYAERYGASGFTVGVLFAVYSLAQLVGAPLLGRLSDHIGRKPVIVIALLGTAVGSFVTGAAGVLWVLFLGRIIDGASGGSLSVAQAAVADIAPPDQRPRLLGLLGAAFGVGFVLGPAIGGLAALGGPHVPFYVAGVLATVNAIAAMVRMPETRRDSERHTGGVKVPHAPVLRRLAVVGFITVFAFTAFEATFSLFGQRRFDLTESGTSVLFLLIGVVLVVMQGGVYHRLAARTGPGRLYLSAVLLIAVGLGLTGAAMHWPVLIIALMFLALGQGMANPAITTLVTQHASPQRRGEALGFQQSAYAVARILGPPSAGAMFDHVGIWSPYVAAGGLCVVGAVLVVSWRIERPAAADVSTDRASQAV
ncbi:MAG: hypothetical protein JWM12_3468 [Ilumatobacteraceae bacterium]|nr:hypothetical protein [Ilumatobacteraceae bacterium]